MTWAILDLIARGWLFQRARLTEETDNYASRSFTCYLHGFLVLNKQELDLKTVHIYDACVFNW